MNNKANAIINYFLSLIVFGCVFICFGLGITTNSSSLATHASIFDLTFGKYAVPMMTVTFFLLLLAVVMMLVSSTLLFIGKVKVGGTLISISGVLTFVVGMLYFFTWAFVSSYTNTNSGLNVASIFNGILLTLSGVASFFLGAASKVTSVED